MTGVNSPLRIGSLFSGYGGLDMGVQSVIGGTVAWHAEIEPAPSRILEHHWPTVPNHGDITTIDWAAVEPVDVLTGGFPCQDVSLAGLRRGLRPTTRSGLWSHYALAIDALRPSLVIVENVRGLLSAEANSDLEPDAWDLGDRQLRPSLRALGAVLGDLADLGYDAEWFGVRAADAGAPHERFRVFLAAYPQRDERAREREQQPWGAAAAGSREGAPSDTSHVIVNWAGRARHWRPESADRRVAPSDSDGGRLREDVFELLPEEPDAGGRTPADTTHDNGGRGAGTRTTARRAWGQYGPAIARWEATTNREAPAPTEAGRLSPAFVEWMMGLPAGHVTGVGLSRSQQLKALGNGVVPQQASLAVRTLLGLAA